MSPAAATPREYLLAWRMAVAKDLLRRGELGLAEVAARVGYGSTSAFSSAFRPPRSARLAALPGDVPLL